MIVGFVDAPRSLRIDNLQEVSPYQDQQNRTGAESLRDALFKVASKATKNGHSLLNSRFLKLVEPSGSRQQISPSRIAECARTEWAMSSESCGQDLKVWPLRETRVAVTFDVREGAEPIHFLLKEPVRVVERLGDAKEAHGGHRANDGIPAQPGRWNVNR